MPRRIPWVGFVVAAVVVGAHLCFERYMYDAGIDWSVQLVFFAALGLLLLAMSEPAQRYQPATGWLLRWGGGLILATLIFMLGFSGIGKATGSATFLAMARITFGCMAYGRRFS